MCIRTFRIALTNCLAANVASGCMAMAVAMAGVPVPGYGVDERMATSMGCDLADIKARAEHYRKTTKYLEELVPAVGNSGCDVLAKLGSPHDTKKVQTEAGTSLNFWYRTPGVGRHDPPNMHLVTLKKREIGTGYLVTSVVW